MARPLLPASFRGAGFKVEAAESDHGRRAVRHDYPLRDLPYYEDLGRKAKEFRVTAFVIGDDYEEQLDALLRACEASGPGELVHPWYGTLRVQCAGASVSHSSSEGRMARVSLTFGEAGEQRFPTARPDPASEVGESARILKELAAEEAVEDLVVEGVPEHVRQAAAEEVVRVANEILEADVFGGTRDQVAQLRRRLLGLIQGAPSDVTTPEDVVAEIVLSVEAVALAAGSTTRTVAAMLGLAARSPGAYSDAQAAQNAAAISRVTNLAALAVGAEAAAGGAYESRQQALATRDALADAIDVAAEDATDAAFQALLDLRTRLTGAVPPPDQDLPELAILTLGATTPALVVAYDLYEDATRDAEIVARNRIRHPGFVPAATPLEVLLDA